MYEGGADSGSPNQFHVSNVREAIAILAGQESAGEGVELGQGVWRGKNGDGEKLVLVGPGEAVVVANSVVPECVRRPRVAGLKLHMDAPRDAQWYQFEKLSEYLRLADDPKWRSKHIDEAYEIFEQWYWKNTTGVCPALMAGLVMATWVQSVWHWRPLVSIIGPSDCGKSTLFELLETIFGPLSMLSSKSSRPAFGRVLRIIRRSFSVTSSKATSTGSRSWNSSGRAAKAAAPIAGRSARLPRGTGFATSAG